MDFIISMEKRWGVMIKSCEDDDAPKIYLDENEYISILKTILNAKMNALASKDPIKAKAAVVRYASSRGFETNLIFKYMPDFPGCDDDL